MRDRIFYSICFGFIFGVLLRSFFHIDLYFTLVLSGIAFALILFFSGISFNRWGIAVAIFVLASSVGIFRYTLSDNPPPQVFEQLVGSEANFTGVIVEAPEFRENSQKLVVEVEEAETKIKILVTVGFDEEYKYGDEVNIAGTLEKPENFVTDQGKEFDYVNYLHKDGILYLINYADIEVLSEGNGSSIKRALFTVKDKFLEQISFAIQSPESLLLGGLILGEKSAFSEDLRQDFINTGTIHIVALSGYNVTIVAEWIMKVLYFLPLLWSFTAGMLGIILFVVMAGGQSTAVRAGTMAVLSLIARATGRTYDVARALILVGVIMIIFNPLVLVHDVSFQLSFIATVAVIFYSPRIEKYFTWATKKFGLRDVISVTTACYIFVLPFILYKMGSLSLVALPANVLILPLIAPIMLLGFLTGFLGILWYGLSVPSGYIAYLMLDYQLYIVNMLADVPFASLSIPAFPLWLVVIIYLYFIYYLFGKSIKSFFNNTPV